MTRDSRHVAVVVDRPWQDVADYVGDPANLPEWAEGVGSGVEQQDGVWTATTPAGRVEIRFVERNPYGVADHDVLLPSGEAVHVPLRVLPLGDGAEVVLSVRRAPAMTEAAFEADEAAVRADLDRLKRVLEGRPAAGA